MHHGLPKTSSQTELFLLFVLFPDYVEVPVFPIAFPQLHGAVADVLAIQLSHGTDEILKIQLISVLARSLVTNFAL